MVGIQRISNPLEDAFSFRLILHFLGVAIHHAMATGTVIASEMPRSISTITPIVDSKSHRISFKRRNQPFPRSRLKIKYPASDFRIVRETAGELLGNKLPEHLKSGGIPPFFRVRPWHQYCLPFGYTATFIISGFFSPVTDNSFCFPDTERYFRRILNAPTASALNLTPSVIYIPRSFRFDDSAYLFDISGENGLHWLV